MQNVKYFKRHRMELALRRNEKLVGAHFAIGVEDALFLRGELPILHASADNTTAIRLYEELGFRLRAEPSFVAVMPPKKQANEYAEIAFTPGALALDGFLDTGAIQLRLHNMDYAVIDQTADYSFDCSMMGNAVDSTKITKQDLPRPSLGDRVRHEAVRLGRRFVT